MTHAEPSHLLVKTECFLCVNLFIVTLPASVWKPLQTWPCLLHKESGGGSWARAASLFLSSAWCSGERFPGPRINQPTAAHLFEFCRPCLCLEIENKSIIIYHLLHIDVSAEQQLNIKHTMWKNNKHPDLTCSSRGI